MSGYYDTKNQALNADIRTERPYPIVTVRAYVEKAVQAGVAVLNEPIEEFYDRYQDDRNRECV